MIQTNKSINNNKHCIITNNINTLECIFDSSHITTFQKNNKNDKCIRKLCNNILDLNSIINKNIAMIQTNQSINNNKLSIITNNIHTLECILDCSHITTFLLVILFKSNMLLDNLLIYFSFLLFF